MAAEPAPGRLGYSPSRLRCSRCPCLQPRRGQRQATAIARTALWGSKLLILDEPAAALGIKESEEALQLIDDVAARGIPLIVVSHNIEHVFRIATRIVALRQGRVTDLKRKESTPDEVVGFITGSRGVSVNGA